MEDFDVTFWGVRGSRPVSSPKTLKFGGNTPCVQMQLGERMLIFDAGTGICNLAQRLIAESRKVSAELFISHTHWDHIQGFPFFTPAFQEENTFTLYGQKKERSFESIMKGTMRSPHFPIQLEEMGASIDFVEIEENKSLDLGDGIALDTFPTNHPNGCLAYRVSFQGRTCVYFTDYEHHESLDEKAAIFLQDSDMVIYDAHYTDEEYVGLSGYPSRKGWGHSTWQEGVKLIKAAQAKQMILFHHGTHRADDDIEELEKRARRELPFCYAAREGMSISL